MTFPNAATGISFINLTFESSSFDRIHPNLRSTMYCNGIAAGGEKEWNFAWDMFRASTNAQESEKLRAALACAKQPWLLNR